MADKAQKRSRWLGAVFLGIALLTLIAGETVFRNPTGKLICWLLCFVSTLMAIVIAFWDLYAVRHHAREEQRALLEDTLTEIERRKEAKSKTPKTANDCKKP